MAANFNLIKVYSTVEMMGGCEYSLGIIIVTLEERIVGTNFFRNKQSAERITQTMDDFKFSCQNKYSALQRMDDCHSFCDKNKCTT